MTFKHCDDSRYYNAFYTTQNGKDDSKDDGKNDGNVEGCECEVNGEPRDENG